MDKLLIMIKRHLNRSRKRLQRLALGIAISAVPAICGAQQTSVPGVETLAEEAVEEVRQYGVEMIIFEFTDRGSAGSEIFAPDPLPQVLPEDSFFSDGSEVIDPNAPFDSDLDLFEDEDADSKPEIPFEGIALSEIPSHEQAGLKVLPPEEYVLDDVYSHLRRLDAYRPIMRTAWVQPTLEKADTLPISLRRLGNPPLRLDGSVSLYLSRFLHLVVDLSLEEKAPLRVPTDDNRARNFGDQRSLRFEREFVTPTITYRIEEDRIVRNGELRYYDHPRFGVVAKIWRIEEETADDEAPEILPNR